jgi:hypothetical protein
MRNSLEKRLVRLEQLAAKRNEKALLCTCRALTFSHDSSCLAAIMKGVSRVCPSHDFREIGGFGWCAESDPLVPEDNQFCPCRPHPMRSFLLSDGPHTPEGLKAAEEASQGIRRDDFPYREDSRRSEAIRAKYREDRRQWLQKSGRQLPSLEELRKLEWERKGEHVDHK